MAADGGEPARLRTRGELGGRGQPTARLRLEPSHPPPREGLRSLDHVISAPSLSDAFGVTFPPAVPQ